MIRTVHRLPGGNTPPTGNIIKVGNGGPAMLNITQASTGAVAGDVIEIMPGTYGGISIADFDLPVGEVVYITNGPGLVLFNFDGGISRCKGIEMRGNILYSLPYNGFKFANINSRALKVYDYWTRVTLARIDFADISQDAIIPERNVGDIPYDGTAATRMDQIRVLNCNFTRCGAISMGGGISYNEGYDNGLYKDFEVAYCTFKDMGNCIYTGNQQDYKFHHNRFENINQNYFEQVPPNGPHNGIIVANGNGDCYNNYITNFQGNLIRNFVYSRGNTPGKSRIFNNIAYISHKYGLGEFQSYAIAQYPGKTTYTECYCFGNTVEKTNQVGDWHGTVVDLYGLSGGTLHCYNNVLIDNIDQYIINNQGGAFEQFNNRYYATRAEAGLDADFKPISGSPLIGAGIKTDEVILDFLDGLRSNPPAIGAIEA